MSAQIDRRSFNTYRGISLPLLISIALVLVALVPLLITFLFIFTQTTPTLINQANKAMENDAQTRVQLIDNYLQERLLDVETVQQAASQVPNVQAMLTIDQPGSPAFQRDATIGGYYIVEIGMIRSKDYRDWAIFSKTGQLLLAYPQQNIVQPHGTALIPQAELKMVNTGKTFISPVYYSPQTRVSSVDIYAPIMAATQRTQLPTSTKTPPPIGILRATLDLKYIAGIVQADSGNNGNGSYAYITDNNGIRIIDPGTAQRYTSVAPLSASEQQQVTSEQRFGTKTPVRVLADPAAAQSLASGKQSSSFQEQPAAKNSQFQVLRQALSSNIVPWNYFVLSPVLSETAVAQQEQLNILIVAILTTLTTIVIGLLAGQSISRPILRAILNLQRNSEKLNALATRQKDTASSQMWVVESSQMGLKSTRYYSHATNFSSHTTLQMYDSLVHSWPNITPQERSKKLEQIIECVQYTKQASSYLGMSNQQLGSALTLAVEVAEQLNEGSHSAGESAEQLNKIVRDLRVIIGR